MTIAAGTIIAEGKTGKIYLGQTTAALVPSILLLLPVLELIIEHRVPAHQRNLSPVDEKVFDVRPRFQYITIGDHEVGYLALLN